MFGAMAAIGAVGGIINAIGGISKSASGAKMMRRAQEAINNYQRQKLQNAYGDVGISTVGADYFAQNMQARSANYVDALRSGGMRGLGNIQGVQRNIDRGYQQMSTQLDQQVAQRNMAYAGDNARIRAIQEQREREDLAGLGRQLEVGRQDKYGGLQDVGQGLLSMGAIGASAASAGLGNPFAGAGSPGIANMGNIGGYDASAFAVTNPMFTGGTAQPTLSQPRSPWGQPINPVTGLPY